ncbi:MAG: FAD:protein FMN transferase [Oscillospiraceae bacterium]|nr:FAD:protein FMN transferase [Oscillospiraceae bacterium]
MPAVQTMFPALGTVNTITLYDTPQKLPADCARSLICSLDRSLSVFRPDSEISRLNARAGCGWTEISPDAFSVFRESLRCSELTDGAFDVTAGPLSALWRDAIRERKLPSARDIRRARRLTGYRDLQLDDMNSRARLRKAGQSVDLGGIAKGYAAGRAAGILRDAGVSNAVINLGGTVGVLGRAQTVGIQDPCRPTGTPLGSLTLKDAFAVTSGGYERGFTIDGVRRHHIIDPRTGTPSDSGLLSVTLVGRRPAELDALATAVFILGAEASMPLLRERDIGAVFVTEEGGVFITPDLSPDFKLYRQKGA